MTRTRSLSWHALVVIGMSATHGALMMACWLLAIGLDMDGHDPTTEPVRNAAHRVFVEIVHVLSAPGVQAIDALTIPNRAPLRALVMAANSVAFGIAASLVLALCRGTQSRVAVS